MNITILLIVVAAIVSFFLGYYLGQGNILEHLRKNRQNKKTIKKNSNSSEN